MLRDLCTHRATHSSEWKIITILSFSLHTQFTRGCRFDGSSLQASLVYKLVHLPWNNTLHAQKNSQCTQRKRPIQRNYFSCCGVRVTDFKDCFCVYDYSSIPGTSLNWKLAPGIKREMPKACGNDQSVDECNTARLHKQKVGYKFSASPSLFHFPSPVFPPTDKQKAKHTHTPQGVSQRGLSIEWSLFLPLPRTHHRHTHTLTHLAGVISIG